jgi:protein PsiE
MLEAIRRLGTATGNLHQGMKDTADTIGSFLVDAFHLLALFAMGATTVWPAAAAFVGMAAQGRASLGDILLLFIYLEIGAMVGIYCCYDGAYHHGDPLGCGRGKCRCPED